MAEKRVTAIARRRPRLRSRAYGGDWRELRACREQSPRQERSLLLVRAPRRSDLAAQTVHGVEHGIEGQAQLTYSVGFQHPGLNSTDAKTVPLRCRGQCIPVVVSVRRMDQCMRREYRGQRAWLS